MLPRVVGGDEAGMAVRRFGRRWSAVYALVTVLSLEGCDNIGTGDRHVLSGGAVGAAAGAVVGAVTGSSVAGAILGGVIGMAVSSLTTKDRGAAENRPANPAK
jgi:hypothetical protein